MMNFGGELSFPVQRGKQNSEAYWVKTRAVVIAALEDYPEAQRSVVRALLEVCAMDEGESG